MILSFFMYHFETLQVDNSSWWQIPQSERPQKNSDDNYDVCGFWDTNSRNHPQQKKIFAYSKHCINFFVIATWTSSYCWYSNQVLGSMHKFSVSNKPHFICDRLILSNVSCFGVNASWLGCFTRSYFIIWLVFRRKCG